MNNKFTLMSLLTYRLVVGVPVTLGFLFGPFVLLGWVVGLHFWLTPEPKAMTNPETAQEFAQRCNLMTGRSEVTMTKSEKRSKRLDANDACRKAVELDPENSQLYQKLAFSYVLLGNTEAAVRVYQEQQQLLRSQGKEGEANGVTKYINAARRYPVPDQ